ncbi:MAG: ABC transporter ATP-binding protein [Candidatus Wallbacteria bacterium]|nr:ABC transporter ATP-binding protein [Candidatus Wallbacteria bacterium]
MSVLTVRSLCKKFDTRPVLNGISFCVEQGQIVAILGRNGQGKSTIFKIIMDFIKADKGEVVLFENAPSGREKVGYLHENPVFWDDLSPREILTGLSGLSERLALDRIMEMVDLVGLKEAADLPVRKFSHGMKQRLGIAQALIGNPELLILDEPLTGLDPGGRIRFRQILSEFKQNGHSVLFSSHELSDVRETADRVIVVNNGSVVQDIPVSQVTDLERFYLDNSGDVL